VGTVGELRECISLWFFSSPGLRHPIPSHHWRERRHRISTSDGDKCLLRIGTHMGVYPAQHPVHFTPVLVDIMGRAGRIIDCERLEEDRFRLQYILVF